MRRDQSRRLGPFYNPGCEDAWILAIGCFDLAPTVNFRPKRVFRARHLHEMTMLRFNLKTAVENQLRASGSMAE
jgi:hypothetical protein